MFSDGQRYLDLFLELTELEEKVKANKEKKLEMILNRQAERNELIEILFNLNNSITELNNLLKKVYG